MMLLMKNKQKQIVRFVLMMEYNLLFNAMDVILPFIQFVMVSKIYHNKIFTVIYVSIIIIKKNLGIYVNYI